ncbi:hypothetical protein D9M68_991510 [compost metagenome]
MRLVVLDHGVDFGLIGLAVGAVGFVIALRVGLSRIDRGEPRRLRTELPELCGARHHLVEGRPVRRGHQRLPLG